ncbi:hypothetical protein [Streptomyces odontomachi]|uniref:hypothetical protein n=1 Tax=Streptomyces odontomachi TaxID=2944940 RepID=UPI00210CF7C8|nr:hypothetical protein [Streptomyces sp. ODS25]
MADLADETDVTGSARRVGGAARRGRLRRAGESAYGLLLLARQVALVGLVLLIVAAGVRTSWSAAGWAAAKDGRGTMTVAHCSDEECTGSFEPAAVDAAPQDRVVLKDTVGTKVGERVAVATRPGTAEVVRTGAAGVFRACLPVGGALVLAAVVIAGGLRMRRTAWVTGVAGLGVLVGAFVTM